MIKEFYEQVKEQYPQLSFEDIEIICSAPFKYLKNIFDNGSLDTVKLKRLGMFRPHPTRVKTQYKNLLKSDYPEEKKKVLLKKIEDYLNEIQSKNSN
jgi:hypothetical protein